MSKSVVMLLPLKGNGTMALAASTPGKIADARQELIVETR